MKEWALWKLKRIKQSLANSLSDIITTIKIYMDFYGQGIIVGVTYAIFAILGALIIWDMGVGFNG